MDIFLPTICHFGPLFFVVQEIIDENYVYMPYKMHGIAYRRIDTFKLLHVGNNWKRLRTKANKVVFQLTFHVQIHIEISR